ncbi:hypothetical protein CSC18_2573 [Klebsiella aerogenes]|nr:hypothetical protein CSC18_2573 [Klebsiella aerogenes]
MLTMAWISGVRLSIAQELSGRHTLSVLENQIIQYHQSLTRAEQ